MQKSNLNLKLVIFRVDSEKLAVYAPQAKLPVATLEHNISLDQQVEKLFKKHFSLPLGNNYTEQLYTLSNDKSEISLIYYILLSEPKIRMSNEWVSVSTKNFQEYEIIAYALQRLQWKIEYTNVVYSLLPHEFTLRDLQKTYEAILDKKLDKRNFRKKILSLKFLKPTGKKRIDNARPAQTYTFTTHTPLIVKIFS